MKEGKNLHQFLAISKSHSRGNWGKIYPKNVATHLTPFFSVLERFYPKKYLHAFWGKVYPKYECIFKECAEKFSQFASLGKFYPKAKYSVF